MKFINFWKNYRKRKEIEMWRGVEAEGREREREKEIKTFLQEVFFALINENCLKIL